VKELKKVNRDKANVLMLPRQANKSTKYEVKKKEAEKSSLTGMAAIQHNIESSKLTKHNSVRPQTAYVGSELKKPTMIGSGGLKNKGKGNPQMKKAKSNVYGGEKSSKNNEVSSNRIQSLLKNSPNNVNFYEKKQHQAYETNTEKHANSTKAQAKANLKGLGQQQKPKAIEKLTQNLENANSLLASKSRKMNSYNQFKGGRKDAPTNDAMEEMDIANTPQDELYFDQEGNVNANIESRDDLEGLKNEHEQLVNIILQEEDDLLTNHRKFIDDSVDLTKKEMRLLHEVDKPGSDVEEYITALDAILANKVDMIKGIRGQLSKFYGDIKKEQELSKLFHEIQNQGDENLPGAKDINFGDIDDPNYNNPSEEDNLLDDDDMLMHDVSDELGAYELRHS
jgi:hypothetical protein